MRVMEQLRQAQESESDNDSLYNKDGEIEVYGRQRALQKKRALITDKIAQKEKIELTTFDEEENKTYISDISRSEDANFSAYNSVQYSSNNLLHQTEEEELEKYSRNYSRISN